MRHLGIGRSAAGRTQNRFAAHRIPLAQGGCDHRLHRTQCACGSSPKQIESIFDTNDVVAIDTLDSGNDAIQVVLYSNNYVGNTSATAR